MGVVGTPTHAWAARETGTWPAWVYTAGLALALIFPSVGMVLTGGVQLTLLYVAAATGWVAVYSLAIAPALLPRLSRGVALAAGLAILGVLAVAIAVVHPAIDTAGFSIAGFKVGATDLDNAVDLGAQALLRGSNPYLERTFTGLPLAPLPGSFLLGLPFHLLGNVAFATILFLAVFWVLGARRSLQSSTLLLVLTITAGPAVVYEALTGMDYTTDVLAVLGLGALTLRVRDRTDLLVLSSAATGVAMATRINLALLAVPLLMVLLRGSGWQRAAIAGISIAAGFLLVSVPFYVWDPAAFFPLQGGADKITGLPFSRVLIPAAGVMTAAGLALLLPHRGALDYFRDAFWMQIVVIALTIGMQYAIGNPVASNFFTYGTLALYPGALFFWGRLFPGGFIHGHIPRAAA